MQDGPTTMMTKRRTGLIEATALLVVCMGLQQVMSQNTSATEGPCGSGTCSSNQFCFQGTSTLCIDCNIACNGCRGPGADQCTQCKVGFNAEGSTCIQCKQGSFGLRCNGTCHCLSVSACDSVSGQCSSGKCEKGYWKPPDCQEECPDLYYGLDCMERCHCLNDSVCDKKLGFCPNNLQCHPDWTSFGCSKRLPKLAKAPSVPVVACSYVTVVWPAWNSNEDFGDGSLPLAEYRLYWRQNGTGSAGWTQAAKIAYNASLKVYQHNVTLVGDRFYEFRVDIHYSDDSKVVENASPGFVTQPLIYVLCTTTTTPPPLTVPIIVGSDIFDNMTASNQPGGAILVTWSIAPNLQRFPWNITLAYRVIATGDCSPETPSALTSFWVNQTVTNYSVASPAAWSRYEVVLTAQGMGVISTAKGTRTISPISAEIRKLCRSADCGRQMAISEIEEPDRQLGNGDGRRRLGTDHRRVYCLP